VKPCGQHLPLWPIGLLMGFTALGCLANQTRTDNVNVCGTCSGDTPVCDPDTRQCVGCLNDTHCPSTTASRCNPDSKTCEACSDNTQCQHLTATAVCDQGTCVQCLGNQDCQAVEGKPVCENKTCVQCNKDDATACGGKACNTLEKVCTNVTPGKALVCSECSGDAQCEPGSYCVPMSFRNMSLGNFCLWDRDAEQTNAPKGSCETSGRPYFSELKSTTSVDGVNTKTFCTLSISTCAAHAHYRNHDCKMSPTQNVADHSKCGLPNQATKVGQTSFDKRDSYCIPVGSSWRCTVPCNNDEGDCPVDALSCQPGLVSGLNRSNCAL